MSLSTTSSRVTERTNPPRPRLAFRVGVVGHRLNRLQQAGATEDVLAKTFDRILDIVEKAVRQQGTDARALYSDEAVDLRLISPLAEGVDRWMAACALRRHWSLTGVFPFAQEEYERDFQGQALQEFRNLIQQASVGPGWTRFEVDGDRTDSPAAYGTAGRVVLNQSDLLIAVWDGQHLGKSGGTEESMVDALRRGIPVLWVDAHAPHDCKQLPAPDRMLNQADSAMRMAAAGASLIDGDGITILVTELLTLPQSERPSRKTVFEALVGDPQPPTLDDYSRETAPTHSVALVWQAFRDLVAGERMRWVTTQVEPFEEAVAPNWPNDRSRPVSAMVDTLRPYYAWPDKLAVLYSNRYRSAFILGFLLSAFAVAAALWPVGIGAQPHSHHEQIGSALELLAITGIGVLITVGRWQGWHHRWLTYRQVAESIRQWRIVAPLGAPRPTAQPPPHLAGCDKPSAAWTEWYVRATTRAIGLPGVTVNRDHLLACLSHLTALMDEQRDFHETTEKRSHSIESRLHNTGLVLLGLTFVACVLHLTHSGPPGHLLTFACGVLPAVGAALAGISNQGEFRRLARRSHAMAEALKRQAVEAQNLAHRIHSAPPQQSGFLGETGAFASECARVLGMEVADWRTVFLDRPLDTPV